MIHWIFLSGTSNRTSAEEMLTLLTREPPDGKEKPEPSKSSLLKMETLSRKSSKCDLLSSNSSSNSPQVIQQQQQTSQSTLGKSLIFALRKYSSVKLYFLAQGHSNGTNQDSRSEATSVCGDNSSVLSGFSGAVQSNTVATSKQAAVNASVAEQVSKRDSASSVVNKNTENGNIYLEHPPPVPPKDELETSTKEW